MTDETQKGRVLSILGEEIIVSEDDHEYICTLRGALKKEKGSIKTLIAVGDFVQFSKKNKTIEKILPRFSIFSRQEMRTQKQKIIAVNIDQVLITASVVMPPLKPALIDRFIIAAKQGNMEPIILINKVDLLEKKSPYFDANEAQKFKSFLEIYKKFGIKVLPMSASTKKGLKDLLKIMKNKSSVFSGQSGVGKSSLINAVTDLELKTGKIIERTKKGAHITSRANLIQLASGGFCIDTPGIKSFGLWELKKEDIASYFSEIADAAPFCKYPNCLHLKEPGCAVKKDVEEGKISSLRFESYRSLMNLEQEHTQR